MLFQAVVLAPLVRAGLVFQRGAGLAIGSLGLVLAQLVLAALVSPLLLRDLVAAVLLPLVFAR